MAGRAELHSTARNGGSELRQTVADQRTAPWQCSECGGITSEHQLFKTRRRWRHACLALAALLAATLWLRSNLVAGGWCTVTPDRLVIALLPFVPDGTEAAHVRSHLRDRLENGSLSTANALRMIDLAQRGDARTPPGSPSWNATYGPWLHAIAARLSRSGSPDDEPLRQGVLRLPPTLSLRGSEIWWADQPCIVTALARDWWPQPVTLQLRVLHVEGIPMDPDVLKNLQDCRWIHNADDQFDSGLSINLGKLPIGEHHGGLQLQWTAVDSPRTHEPISVGELILPIHVDIQSTAPPLTPISDAEIDRAVAACFAPGLRIRPGHPPQFAFSTRQFETSSTHLRSVAFGVIAHACEDGVPRRTLRMWWRGGGGDRSSSGSESPVEDAQRLITADTSPRWTLRIQGDAELAQRAAHEPVSAAATHYWAGSIEIPLQVEVVNAAEMMRPWIMDRAQAPTELLPPSR